MPYTIDPISPQGASSLCRTIMADLPEYFGLPECNESYAQGVLSRTNFSAQVGHNLVGLLSLDFPSSQNARIYWIGILKEYHKMGLGRALLKKAVTYAKEREVQTLTVETVDPKEANPAYLKTYHFYEACDFFPLFTLKPTDYEWNMIYMIHLLK